MKKIHTGFLLIFSVLLFLFSFWGCKSQNEAEGKIPISTSSDEAKEEYLKGRDLAERLQGQESLQYYANAVIADSNFALAYLGRAGNQTTAKAFFNDLNNAVSLAGNVSEGERLQILGFEAGVNANPEKQIEYYSKLVDLFPNDERAHTLLGTSYFGQQDYEKAVDQLNKAADIDSNFAPAYNMLGYSNRQLMNYDAAEKAFKKYIELIPNDPNPYDSYAELLLKQGRYDESIVNYKKALDHNPHFVASVTGIAANEIYKGNFDEARKQTQNLYKMARNDAEKRTANFISGISFIDEGKPDMALTEFKKNYDIAEKNSDYGNMSGDLFNIATVQMEMGNYKEALQNYRKSVEVFDKSASPQELKDNVKLGLIFNEGDIAVRQKDLKTASAKAEEFMKGVKAINNINQIRLAHQLTGMIALEQKKSDDCLSELSKSNLQNPYNYYRMALAYQMKGDKEKAKEYFEQALNFNPLPNINAAFARYNAKKMMAKM